MNPPEFAPGWRPESARAADLRLARSRRYCTVAPAPAPPPRPAVSLSHLRLAHYEQGSQGTCWEHSPKAMFEVTARGLGLAAFPASRRAIGYAAKELFEGGGNQADGGSPTDGVVVMTGSGIGVAHEALCPYVDDRRVLGLRPAADVYADAARTHLVAPVRLGVAGGPPPFDDVVRLVDAGMPVANGFACPSTLQQPRTFVDAFGHDLGGHSVLIWGYMLPGVIDGHLWLEVDNWWGTIYPPLPASVAALVDGYEPVTAAATSSCWIRDDAYALACRLGGYAEHVSATGVAGLDSGTVVRATGFDAAFPI